jgi:hypothetical protein
MVTVEQNLSAEGLMGVKIIPEQGIFASFGVFRLMIFDGIKITFLP